MSAPAPGGGMLRAATRLFAGAGLASGGLLALLFALRAVLPLWAAWALAYGVVLGAMACAVGFAWIGLTLPAGAPWRTKALAVSAALAGAIGAASLLAV